MNTETNYRGQSVYEIIELDGWKCFRSPFHMRGSDCFRKGNRRCYITNERDENGRCFYYAVEGFPKVDGFGQRYWESGKIVAADENTPFSLLQKA